jgi:hypothetical protein
VVFDRVAQRLGAVELATALAGVGQRGGGQRCW